MDPFAGDPGNAASYAHAAANDAASEARKLRAEVAELRAKLDSLPIRRPDELTIPLQVERHERILSRETETDWQPIAADADSFFGPVTDKTLTMPVFHDLGDGFVGKELVDAPIGKCKTEPTLTADLGRIAGIVKTPGIDDALDAIESEADIVEANRELLEGRPLSRDESERWQRLFNDVQRECNKRLEAKGIVLLAACPEPNGLGGVLVGCDRLSMEAASRGIHAPSEEYTVTVSLPARERVDIARTGREEFARWLIDLVCAECIEQQKAYRQKTGRA